MMENDKREMDETEWTEFLRHGTRTGKLSINLPSGRPTVTPIWFVMDDDGILRIATGADSAKARALSADPTLTLGVATDIGRRYMGEELADVYGQRNGGPGQVTIEFTPTRIIAIHDISG
jgi:hypothetical protein